MSKTIEARRYVLKALESGPADDYMIAKLIRHGYNVYLTPSNLRSRRAELVRDGLVKPVQGWKVKSPTGRFAQVWSLA